MLTTLETILLSLLCAVISANITAILIRLYFNCIYRSDR